MSTHFAPTRYDSTKVVSSLSRPNLVIAMVGLPARGKSYISKKILRYLNLFGIGTRIFNAGDYRRKITNVQESGSAEFYNPDNEQAKAIREQCAALALHDLTNWLKSGQGQVAIFDATNTTKDRRAMLYKTIVDEQQFDLFFIESVCNDEDQINKNIVEAKAKNDDFKDGHLEMEKIIASFKDRISNYVRVYQELDPIDESHLAYFKIIDGWQKVEVRNPIGPIQERVVNFLKSIHIAKRLIYLVPSEYEQIAASYLHNQNEFVRTFPTLDIASNLAHDEVVKSLDQLILSVEQEHENVLLVANSTGLPILLDYLIGEESSQEILPNTLVQLTPDTYKYIVKQISLDLAIRSS